MTDNMVEDYEVHYEALMYRIVTAMAKASAEEMSTWNYADLVHTFRSLEAALAELEAKYKKNAVPMEEVLEKLRGAMTLKMDADGLTSTQTVHGTPYFRTINSIRVIDRQIFFDWVFETQARGFLTAAINKDAVNDRLQQGDDAPPGVEVIPVRKLHVRKPS